MLNNGTLIAFISTVFFVVFCLNLRQLSFDYVCYRLKQININTRFRLGKFLLKVTAMNYETLHKSFKNP